MKKKERLVLLLILLIILILICRSILSVKNLSYKIKVDNITYTIKEKNKGSYYHIDIKNNDLIYPINIFDNLNNKRKVVTKIYSYNDKNYKCIFPLIDKKQKTDVMCYENNIIYNYNTIKGKSSKLDNFVSNIKEYQESKDNLKYDLKDTIKFFDNKIDSKVAITTYKGLYINEMPINLFEKDIYKNTISTFVSNYYLTADYNSKYEFKKFYLVDINKIEIKELELKDEISFDSYIQGIVKDKVYLYDNDNKNQYEIDVKNKKVNLVSSNDYIKYYTNTKWEKVSKSKLQEPLYFDYSTLDNYFTDYDYVKDVDKYFYLLNKKYGYYDIYRVDKTNVDIKTYLGTTPTKDLKFNKNYLYYMYDNKLYYYSDQTGFKTILENTEVEFNDTIKYYIY